MRSRGCVKLTHYPKVWTRTDVYETLCPQHMLAPKDNLQMINFCSIPLEESPCSLSPKRGIIQSNFDRIVWKVNQVIHIMYLNCMAYIKILAQALLQMFCSQGCFNTQNASQKREIIQSNIYRILLRVIRSSTPWTQSVCQISWP